MTQEKTPGIDRRTFLKNVSAGAATLANASALAAQPGPAQPPSADTPAPSPRRTERTVYRGEKLRAVAMPLGGIGTGSIALAGDGGLRQWQIVHNVNHLAHVPHSFFGFWAKTEGSPGVARVLQSSALYDQSNFQPPVTSNDHVVPAESRRLLEQFPGVKELEFAGEYPIAQIRYLDTDLPAEISLEAYSPFIPLNAKDSGLPVIVFEFKVKNPGSSRLRASLLATLQNLVGWDGQSPIVGVENFAYGSNRNMLARARGIRAIELSNPRLPDDFPFQGRLVLAALSENASYCTQWDNLESLWKDFSEEGELANREGEEPSALGRTWNSALAVPLELQPGEAKTVAFLIAWFFPNRYVTWSQPALTIEDRKSKFWLGTMCGNWFKGPLEVAYYVRENFERLTQETRRYRIALYDSTLPFELLDSVSSQASIIRTPTCIWIEDGHLHGFEGCCGASTTHCGNSGCCPLNCTHVWNYEQSLSRLFPDLERTMRHTDLEVQQHPSGYIPHRTILPFYLPRNWGRKIGGPENPALDGMLGTVLKTYREYRQGAGKEWLSRLWPHVKKLMEYVMNTLDPDGEGVIRGEQPNTYDISIYGPNAFIGSLYLAALRAAEEMARRTGDRKMADRYREVYARGRVNLPREVWNGEYYVQKVNLEKHLEYQYGLGCHADQLLGQWWAHQLDLGYLLPEDQVRTTLDSILKHNWREDFADFRQEPRAFASEHDKGLLICTWPKGGRPKVPTLYSDEVWTGIEYEVAGLLLYEGRDEDAMKILRGVRARYDGRERSPWNDIECGDHYARAMSSWTLLEAAAGQRYNAAEEFLAFAPNTTPENFRCFFITAAGWGTFDQRISQSAQVETLSARYGRITLRTLEFACGGKATKASAMLNGKTLPLTSSFIAKAARLEASPAIELNAGDSLQVVIS
ncbi:MAG: GH116 family glycosyl-hydrolase [Terriglobia bacterium]